jgi:hypothetical protein
MTVLHLRLTIHSSRTRFVASRLRLTSRAGRLNSGVSPHMQKFGVLILLCFATVEATAAPVANHVRSYFPAKALPAFLVKNLDIASFRNSLGPKRQGERTFAELGITPTKIGPDVVEFDSPDWYYRIRVLRREDINRDGIEDLELCFTDRAKQGSYSTQQPLLVTKYSSSMLATALSYEVSGCEEFSR